MLYGLKIALRYLTASKAQTALLVLGVAVGVFIFIFMSALIGGLAEFILSRTVGDISHEQSLREDGRVVLGLAAQKVTTRKRPETSREVRAVCSGSGN